MREKASERTGNGELIPLVHLYIVPGLNPPGLSRLSDPHSALLEVDNRLHSLVRNQSHAPPSTLGGLEALPSHLSQCVLNTGVQFGSLEVPLDSQL